MPHQPHSVTLITVELFGEGEWILMIGTLAVTFAILVFSEITPKVIAAAYPEKLGYFMQLYSLSALKSVIPSRLVYQFICRRFA